MTPVPGESIHELLGQAMARLKALGKGERYDGPGGFRFRGIDSTINAVGPVFRELGIVGPVPEMLSIDSYDHDAGKGKVSSRVIVQVRYHFFGPHGDSLTATTPGEALDFGDKATAKAMSVACRIALLQTLCLPTDEPDPDEFVEGLTAAQHARNLLTDTMTSLGLDPADVVRRYTEEYKVDPRVDENVAHLSEFTKTLMAEGPKWRLQAKEPASVHE